MDIWRKAEDDYLLTTKLHCGYCGALMFGESGTSRTGEVHRYYKCATAKKHKGCKKKTVRKQWLEDLVVNETMKLVENDASMNAIIAKVMELQNQESTDPPIYEKQLKETEVGITNMLNAIQIGDPDQFHERTFGGSGRTAEGAASPHCRGTAGQVEDERRIRPVLAASFPQAGYDPAGAAAGTGGYLHQCHLSLR